MRYLQFFVTPVIMLSIVIGLFMGGPWLWWGVLLVTLIMVPGDMLLGEYTATPTYRYTGILNFALYLTLPVLLVILVAFAWTLGHGGGDLFGLGAWVQGLWGYDALAARADNRWYHYLGGVLSVGFAVGGYGINVSHELTHRVWHKFSWIWGRWILSLSLSTDFSQEHVYGHHLTVATPQDPATARRGETVYAFVPRSIWGSLVNAWRWEAARLSKKGYAVWGLRNQVLRGWGMSLAIGAFFYYAAGPLGLALFVAQAMWARTLLEVVNYMEHYGLVRVPAQRVQPRHSWNTNKLVSSLILFSLTRHSAHHEKGSVPFWRLNPYPEAPEMPFGYLTTIYVALLPPLWFAIMKPKLAHWDQNYATAEELELLQGN